MKAAKRASQIKGFMRFSFFKQALTAVILISGLRRGNSALGKVRLSLRNCALPRTKRLLDRSKILTEATALEKLRLHSPLCNFAKRHLIFAWACGVFAYLINRVAICLRHSWNLDFNKLLRSHNDKCTHSANIETRPTGDPLC